MKWVNRWILFCLFLLSIQLNGQHRIQLETGDFLFIDLDCGPLCDAIESVTQGYNGEKFSHIGLVYFQNDSALILEAIGSSVKLTPLKTFLKYTKKPAVVGRLKPSFRHIIPKAIEFGLEKLGLPYDDEFLPNNGKYYCSELLYDVFKSANDDTPIFTLEPMTFKMPGTNKFFPAWVDYYQKLIIEIPEGELGCNPGGLSRSEHLDIIGKL